MELAVAVGVAVGVAVADAVGVAVGVAVAVGVGEGVGVGVGVGAAAQYLPPVLTTTAGPPTAPPQTIISLPVHTPLGASRASGALVVLVAVQLSVLGLYLPPVFIIATPTQSFHCRSILLCETFGQWAHWWCWWQSNCRCWDYTFRR